MWMFQDMQNGISIQKHVANLYTSIRLIAERIFSMPATAADFEQRFAEFFLSAKAAFPWNLLKSLHIKTYINYEHDGEGTKAQQVSEAKKKEISSLGQRVDASGNQALDSTVPSIPPSTGESALFPPLHPLSEVNEEALCELDSESSDDTGALDEFLKSVKATLQMENLFEMAHDFLDDEDNSSVLTEEQMQSRLYGPPAPSQTPPHPQRRKLLGHKRVRRSLESLFEFNVFKETAEDLYEIELITSRQ